ncbi:hypothetical protein SNEBB_007630 [Seison nebaliae]|nr:hypothetical protein SNEBB_007630 [Seison nebaliae]
MKLNNIQLLFIFITLLPYFVNSLNDGLYCYGCPASKECSAKKNLNSSSSVLILPCKGACAKRIVVGFNGKEVVERTCDAPSCAELNEVNYEQRYYKATYCCKTNLCNSATNFSQQSYLIILTIAISFFLLK